MTSPADICKECGGDGECLGDYPTNTGPTAVDPGYREAWECTECGFRWSR